MNYGNGYRDRRRDTRAGTIELAIPRLGQGLRTGMADVGAIRNACTLTVLERRFGVRCDEMRADLRCP